MNEITKSLEVKTLLQPYDWGNKHPAISAMTLGTSGAISCWLIASIKWDGKGEKKKHFLVQKYAEILCFHVFSWALKTMCRDTNDHKWIYCLCWMLQIFVYIYIHTRQLLYPIGINDSSLLCDISCPPKNGMLVPSHVFYTVQRSLRLPTFVPYKRSILLTDNVTHSHTWQCMYNNNDNEL